MTQSIAEQDSPSSRPKALTTFTIVWTVAILISMGISLRAAGISAFKDLLWVDLLWLDVLYVLWRGACWARHLFLILLPFTVLIPLFYWDGSLVSWQRLGIALLAAFSIYWLNSKPVRSFFISSKNPMGIGNRLLRIFVSIAVGLYVASWLRAVLISLWIVHFGAGSWARTKEDLIKRGEKLTWAELISQKVPNESENFYADPIWMELLETKSILENGKWVQEPKVAKKDRLIRKWNTPFSASERESIAALRLPSSIASERSLEAKALVVAMTKSPPSTQASIASRILEILEPLQPLTDHLAELLKRPSAYYPIQYQDNFATLLPHVPEMLNLAQMLGARSQAELVVGKPVRAFEDIKMILGLEETMRDQPIMIPLLVRESMIHLACETINHGVLHQQWSDAELAGIEQDLHWIDLQQNLATSLCGARACFYATLREMTDSTVSKLPPWRRPSDIIIPDQMNYYSRTLQATLDLMQQHKTTGWNASLPLGSGFHIKDWRRYLRNMVSMVMPALDGAFENTAEYQTQVDQTRIACALERYRLAHGAYPTSLDAVVPEYLPKLPNSPITGKPMNYSLKPDGTFLLWSPGWNLKSLGGKPGEFKGDGDIVWGQPVSRKTKESSNPVAKGK
jgi:hypothetical protein